MLNVCKKHKWISGLELGSPTVNSLYVSKDSKSEKYSRTGNIPGKSIGPKRQSNIDLAEWTLEKQDLQFAEELPYKLYEEVG